ncbi:uncharacterized protein RCO7_04622 [Rhynchosporium graminicola]|uniref:2EXR domain-containing protein n=1 Tax=Rhynchosporium graminicola TaxID=2792576 RepID=A0A1E1JT60_9HELO|nr:uncharacterized protein RCO7_04622 [Rhynchosporium commune]
MASQALPYDLKRTDFPSLKNSDCFFASQEGNSDLPRSGKGLASTTDLPDTSSTSKRCTLQVLEKFIFFPNLSFEIRNLVFEACVFPRNVRINGSIGTMSFNTADPKAITIFSVPVLFHINTQSREIAKKRYQCFEYKYRFMYNIPIYFNPALDTFLCFARTADPQVQIEKGCSPKPASCFRHESLSEIPHILRSHIRRIVIMDRIHYLAGITFVETTALMSEERKKYLMHQFLSKQFGALEQVLVVGSIDAPNQYATRPQVEQLSQIPYKEGSWDLVQEVKKENPGWKGPDVFLGKIMLG